MFCWEFLTSSKLNATCRSKVKILANHTTLQVKTEVYVDLNMPNSIHNSKYVYVCQMQHVMKDNFGDITLKIALVCETFHYELYG